MFGEFGSKETTCERGSLPSQTVDSRFYQNQVELGVLILSVALKVLADRHSLVLY